MSPADPFITGVEVRVLTTIYPRTVGRNARLGSHGAGGESTIAVISTDGPAQGWGLVESVPVDRAAAVGCPLSDLIDPAAGVRSVEHRWLDIALHDLVGVVNDVPVHALLGGAGSTDIEVYDGAIYFDDLDPDDDPRGLGAVLDNCRADADAGHRSFKLKIGRGNRWLDRDIGDARDIEVTHAVRGLFPQARLLVDANDGYDLDGFLRYLDAVADVGLYWVEEPFGDSAVDLAELRAHLDTVSPGTLVADGETAPDVESLLPVAAAGHLDVLLMDVMSYGVTAWRALMPRVAEIGVVASPHAWGRPLKTLYAAQLAAGLGHIDVVEGVPGRTVGVDTSTYPFAEGFLTVPDRPGFGLPVPS